MKKTAVLKKLHKLGYTYKYTHVGYIATRAQQTYTATTLNGLYNKIFK